MAQREILSANVHYDDDAGGGKSFSTSTTSYDMVCKKRIKDIKKLQDEQFKSEMKNLEAMQTSAYDQLRVHRFFAITTLWPALHSRREIENTLAKYHAMMPKGHVERINYILENKLN